MQRDRRDIYFYDLELRPRKKAAVAPALLDVVRFWRGKVEAGEADYRINHRKETLTLREIEIDEVNAVATLLVTHSNPAAPNAVYGNPEQRTTRVLPKEPGEAGEFGAHILISLKQEAGRAHNYLAVIERVPSLSRANIERLLNGIIREQYQLDENTFCCEDQSGKRTKTGDPVMVGFRPIVRFAGHPSEDFIRDLEEGKLSGITMIQSVEQIPLGRRPYLLQHEKRLKIKVTGERTVANLWDDLKGAFSSEAANWSKARIKFINSEGRSAEVNVDTSTGNVFDDAYVKTARINDLNPPLDNSSERIVRQLADKMVAKLLDHRTPAA